MQLQVKDAVGDTQVVITSGVAVPLDWSGAIVADGQSQVLLAANADRSGWLMQNQGANNMVINELGAPAAASVVPGAGTPPQAGAGSFNVPPGAFFPPPGFPLTITAINVLGSAGDTYVLREW